MDWIGIGTMEPTTSEELQVRSEERKTVDLCGVETTGARCVRERGHDGEHECPLWHRSEPLRWR